MPLSSFPRGGGGRQPRRRESIFGVSLRGCLEEGAKGQQHRCSVRWARNAGFLPVQPWATVSFCSFKSCMESWRVLNRPCWARMAGLEGRWTVDAGREDWQDTGCWGSSKGEQSCFQPTGCHAAPGWLRDSGASGAPQLGNAHILSAPSHPLEAKCKDQERCERGA